MKKIDLRSDTVTLPTPEMRRAMADAPVGDDVCGEDPTVNQLEAEAAAMLGKEAGLFVPSGTMGNQVAVLTHTRRGDEVIVEADSHVFWYEAGAIAAVGACQPRPIAGKRGSLDPAHVAAAIRAEDVHFPRTGLICMENTHNRSGGCIVPLDNLAAVAEIARRRAVPMHLDGARIFNAAVALNIPAAQIAAYFDSVTFCLSKGLGAPVGSVLVASKSFIKQARKNRKMLGGGMRQAGIIAAAGLVSLRSMIKRLAEDHSNAQSLGRGAKNISGLDVDLETVQTNMVLVDLVDSRWSGPVFQAALERAGVLCYALGAQRVRLVTHKDVCTDDIQQALERIKSVMKTTPDAALAGKSYG